FNQVVRQACLPRGCCRGRLSCPEDYPVLPQAAYPGDRKGCCNRRSWSGQGVRRAGFTAVVRTTLAAPFSSARGQRAMTATLPADRVRIEMHDKVAHVVLTRADKHNGMDITMLNAVN